MQDVIETAVKAIDIAGAGGHWDVHNGEDKSLKPHRHGCCGFCGEFGFLSQTLDEKSVKGYSCKKCGESSARMSFRKSAGPNVSETRVSKRRDISDKPLPDLALIRGLSGPARMWVEWGHSAKYKGDEARSKRILETLRWHVYEAVAYDVVVSSKDNRIDLGARLIILFEKILEGRKRGWKEYTNTELSVLVNLDRAAFDKNRRWGKIRQRVLDVIDGWEAEVIR